MLPEVGQRAFEKLFPEPDPYARDPIGWAHNKLGVYLWSIQRKIMESVRDNRFTAVPSCHGSGKSFTASVIANWWIDVHPPGEAFVITTAPTDSQVKAVLWRLIGRMHRRLASRTGQAKGRITLEAKWYQGERMKDEELVGMGRKPQDYNEEAFQGIHAKYVLIIIDEAGSVPKGLWDILETLMTNEYARILAIGNPTDPQGHFNTVCSENSGWHRIRIPAWITPNFTGEYVPTDVAEELVSVLWVNERRTKWGVGSPFWESRVEAKFPAISDDMLITLPMINAAKEKEIAGFSLGCYGVDVARFGMDETCIYRNRDGRVRKIWTGRKLDTVEVANVVQRFMLRHGVAYVPAVIDVIGVGAGVVDTLRHRNLNVVAFHSGESPNDPRLYVNRRAECYWKLREMFENETIDIDPADEDLHNQLMSIKWGLVRRGQIIIESKDDMRKRGLASPDKADAVMMATSGLTGLQAGPSAILGGTISGDIMTKVM
jgi:hypothetical protein